jgi:DNA-binding NarL/FixJ family response regulator
MEPDPMRVLLVDDHPKVRSALRLLIEQECDGCVVHDISKDDCLVDQVLAVSPDLLLLDWEMSSPPSAETVQRLRSLDRRMFIIVMSGRPEMRGVALDAGAHAFIWKGESPDSLLTVLKELIGKE